MTSSTSRDRTCPLFCVDVEREDALAPRWLCPLVPATRLAHGLPRVVVVFREAPNRCTVCTALGYRCFFVILSSRERGRKRGPADPYCAFRESAACCEADSAHSNRYVPGRVCSEKIKNSDMLGLAGTGGEKESIEECRKIWS